MKHFHLLAALFVLGFIILGTFIWGAITGFASSGSPAEVAWTPIALTQNNVAEVISGTNIARDLPSNAAIQLYIGDVAYTIANRRMNKGILAEPEITIRIPESYLALIGQQGLCAGLAQARANSELGVRLESSPTLLAWKYRALAKYKSCLE